LKPYLSPFLWAILFTILIAVPVKAGAPNTFTGAVASDGTVLRVNRISGTAQWLSESGSVISSFPLPFKTKKSVGIAFDGTHIFVFVFNNRRVYELDRTGQLIRKLKFPASIHRLLVDSVRIVAFPSRYHKSASLYWEMDRETGTVRKYHFTIKDLVGSLDITKGLDRKAIIMGLSWGGACLDGQDIRYVVPVGSDLLKIKGAHVLNRQVIPLSAQIRMTHTRNHIPTTTAHYDAYIRDFFPTSNKQFWGMFNKTGESSMLFLWKDRQGILAEKAFPEQALIGTHKGEAVLLNPKTGVITRIPAFSQILK